MTVMTDPLIVDVYSGDGPKDWAALAAAGPPWHGAILKATQGTYYRDTAWLATNWRSVRAAGGVRYGVDWFRGAYHYLDVRQGGLAQADAFLAAIDYAGGWGGGDIWPMVDVERAGQREVTSTAQVIDCVQAFADAIKSKLGRETMLYGGSWLADLAIASRMGCSWLAIARYTPTLPTYVVTRIGWDLSRLALWQYSGDGVAYLAGYPREAPGCGKVDISALVLSGGTEALRGRLASMTCA
jgi:GH25 family lysozyme M1 (1,4-beta-N-acetylmuramidase)